MKFSDLFLPDKIYTLPPPAIAKLTWNRVFLPFKDGEHKSLSAEMKRLRREIPLHQHPNEITELILFLKQRFPNAKTLLEIGAAGGGNTYALVKYLHLESAVIVDDNQHADTGRRKDLLKQMPVEEIIGDSHGQEVLNRLRARGKHYDLIFIDGDHSYEGVRQDTQNFQEFLNPNGLLIYHDTFTYPGVRRHLRELSGLGYNRIFGTFYRFGVQAYQKA